jgi:hypothetical protein
MLYDVSTLYVETDTGDGIREPGFSKERRLPIDHTAVLSRPDFMIKLGLALGANVVLQLAEEQRQPG